MTYWRAAGLTYLQFSSIAARAVRNSLKKELQQSASATPTESSIKMATWKDGKPIRRLAKKNSFASPVHSHFPIDDCCFARSGSRGEYCGVYLVGHVYANLVSHAVSTSPVRDESPYSAVYTDAYSGDGIVVVTLYLAPNISRDDVVEYVDAAMESVARRVKPSDPVVVVGDFNVDVRKGGEWLMEYMLANHSMTCLPLEAPTTINGSYIDLAFARNCLIRAVLQQLLTVHFSDHKAVIMTVNYNDNTNKC